jgi:hypothetical protein
MAFSSTAAQAEPGAVWNVNGTPVTNELKAQIQVTELETLAATGVKEGILLTKTGLTKVEILCTAMKLINALLTTLGGATGKIHFEGCIAKLNGGAAAAACKPHSPGHPEGLIETNALNALIKLHTGGVELLEVLPVVGDIYVTLRLGKEVGSECAIGANFPCLTGSAFVKAGTATELKEETVSKLFSEGPLTALLFGGNPATIDGSAKIALAFPHLGMKWSGKAN